MEDTASFGTWLKQRRRALDLTQAELARRVGCAMMTIQKIEADERRPSREIAARLATVLELPPEEHAAFIQAARAERAVGRLGTIPAGTRSDALPPWRPPVRLPSNLPVPPTPLIGREREVAEAVALLRRANVRLVTLRGPGGVGKTRLSLAVAEALRANFADRVYFVPLAPIGDQALVLPTIAHTLEVRERSAQPLVEQLKAQLRDQRLLLVLDNFEQVVAAAPLVADLLQAAPLLKLLVTSRALLRLQGEREYIVPPLRVPAPPLPPLETLSEYEAIRLFIDRAQDIKADFQVTNANAPLVAEICARLDGLPLAIVLAAARVKILPLETLLQRLGSGLKVLTSGPQDLPARQQTLRSTIEWSYTLLEPAEQRLFARLAVFVGGCTLEAAEAVCNGAGIPLTDVLDGLQSLVEKSLLGHEESPGGEPYFTMLETIREYALEQLAASGEAEIVRARHAAYFVRLAETAEPELVGAQQAVWAQRLDQAHGNLRAALEWALEHRAAETALLLGKALARFWWMRGYLREGRQWLEQVLDRCAPCPPSIRAKALYWIGILSLHQGDYGPALRALEESLAISQQLADRHSVGYALNALGVLANRQRDPAKARQLYAEGLAIYRELGDQERIATLLNNLGFTALLQDDLARASDLLNESLALAYAQQDSQGIAFALNNLGVLALRRRAYPQAKARLQESLRLFWALGDKQNSAECLEGLAQVAVEQGKAEVGARLLGTAEALRIAMGAPIPPYERERYAAAVAAAREQLDTATFSAAWAEGRAMSLEQAIAYALETSDPGP